MITIKMNRKGDEIPAFPSPIDFSNLPKNEKKNYDEEIFNTLVNAKAQENYELGQIKDPKAPEDEYIKNNVKSLKEYWKGREKDFIENSSLLNKNPERYRGR